MLICSESRLKFLGGKLIAVVILIFVGMIVGVVSGFIMSLITTAIGRYAFDFSFIKLWGPTLAYPACFGLAAGTGFTSDPPSPVTGTGGRSQGRPPRVFGACAGASACGGGEHVGYREAAPKPLTTPVARSCSVSLAKSPVALALATVAFVAAIHRRFWGMNWLRAILVTVAIAILSWGVVYPALFAIVGRTGAGSLELPQKQAPPPSITQSEPWQFTIAAPSWMAGMNGTIGINGRDADIDLGLGEILQHLNMIFAMRAEAQKGPFGIFGEFIYIGLSDGAQIGGLVDNVAAEVNTSYADGALSWRLINTPRWSLDFTAGTHYANLVKEKTQRTSAAMFLFRWTEGLDGLFVNRDPVPATALTTPTRKRLLTTILLLPSAGRADRRGSSRRPRSGRAPSRFRPHRVAGTPPPRMLSGGRGGRCR